MNRIKQYFRERRERKLRKELCIASIKENGEFNKYDIARKVDFILTGEYKDSKIEKIVSALYYKPQDDETIDSIKSFIFYDDAPRGVKKSLALLLYWTTTNREKLPAILSSMADLYTGRRSPEKNEKKAALEALLLSD